MTDLPTEFYLALPAIWGGIVYAIRRWLPGLWRPLTQYPTPNGSIAHIAQGLVSVLVGAIASAVASGGDPRAAAIGAFANAFAPVGHHVIKWAPLVPYQGALRTAAWETVERLKKGGAAMIVLLSLGGCASSQPHFSTAEKACLAEAEARADARILACGKRVDGECSTDAIIDDQETESLACLH